MDEKALKIIRELIAQIFVETGHEVRLRIDIYPIQFNTSALDFVFDNTVSCGIRYSLECNEQVMQYSVLSSVIMNLSMMIPLSIRKEEEETREFLSHQKPLKNKSRKDKK